MNRSIATLIDIAIGVANVVVVRAIDRAAGIGVYLPVLLLLLACLLV